MGWYKIAQSEEDIPVKIPGYPYYLAQYRENRFKGSYPSGIRGVRQLERKWDRGDFGVGRTMKEIKSEDLKDILIRLRREGIDPRDGDVDFYEIREPNSPRRTMRLRDVLIMGR